MSPPSCHLFSLAQGPEACKKTNNINVGTNSCHGEDSCNSVSDSTIYNDSCQSSACKSMQRSTIHDGSCNGGQTCDSVKNSIIGKGSCNGYSSCYGMQNATIGNGSCNGSDHGGGFSQTYGMSCEFAGIGSPVKIGNNSCNGEQVCYECKHNVPNNACNQGITDDMMEDGYCNFCGEQPASF